MALFTIWLFFLLFANLSQSQPQPHEASNSTLEDINNLRDHLSQSALSENDELKKKLYSKKSSKNIIVLCKYKDSEIPNNFLEVYKLLTTFRKDIEFVIFNVSGSNPKKAKKTLPFENVNRLPLLLEYDPKNRKEVKRYESEKHLLMKHIFCPEEASAANIIEEIDKDIKEAPIVFEILPLYDTFPRNIMTSRVGLWIDRVGEDRKIIKFNSQPLSLLKKRKGKNKKNDKTSSMKINKYITEYYDKDVSSNRKRSRLNKSKKQPNQPKPPNFGESTLLVFEEGKLVKRFSFLNKNQLDKVIHEFINEVKDKTFSNGGKIEMYPSIFKTDKEVQQERDKINRDRRKQESENPASVTRSYQVLPAFTTQVLPEESNEELEEDDDATSIGNSGSKEGPLTSESSE